VNHLSDGPGSPHCTGMHGTRSAGPAIVRPAAASRSGSPVELADQVAEDARAVARHRKTGHVKRPPEFPRAALLSDAWLSCAGSGEWAPEVGICNPNRFGRWLVPRQSPSSRVCSAICASPKVRLVGWNQCGFSAFNPALQNSGTAPMWISIFAISLAIAIGFGVAAMMMQPKGWPRLVWVQQKVPEGR
jgi:hypothetical protein